MVTLLVVDKDVRGYSALERSLGALGHTLLAATDARAALSVALAEGPSHVLVGPIAGRVGLVRELEQVPGVRAIAAFGPPLESGARGLATLERPLAAAEVAAWLGGATARPAQPARRSARRARVRLRSVLFVVRSRRSLQCPPSTVHAEIVTTAAAAYAALARPYDLVVLDDELRGARQILAVAAEQGRCVYLLTDAGELDEEAQLLGAAGAIAPERIAAVAQLPVRRPRGRVPLDPALRERLLAVIESRLPHGEKLAAIDRMLLETQRKRHGSGRLAAAATGMPRTTFMRRVRGR